MELSKLAADVATALRGKGHFLRKTGYDCDLQYCVVASPMGRSQLVVVTLVEGKHEFNVSTCDHMTLYPFWEVPTA
jgi:hypothetical protein